jgi:hypothetical protein
MHFVLVVLGAPVMVAAPGCDIDNVGGRNRAANVSLA